MYFVSLIGWSVFTLLQGTVALFGAGVAVYVLFALRALVGVAEAPSFPANGRIVAAWFPANERGTAAAIFNAAQYFATVLFAPIMGLIITLFGWPWVFYVMGALGILMGLVWLAVVYDPVHHPRLGRAELDHIRAGRAPGGYGPARHRHPRQRGDVAARQAPAWQTACSWASASGNTPSPR